MAALDIGAPRPDRSNHAQNQRLWYKDAIIYELHVRAFADANGDGVGDFVGLTGKLDYLRDLGVTALWLLPFYPSPLRDDGYDIADYTDIHESYGTLDDFARFLEQAHQRDLRVITELPLNHTSREHAWFQRARRAPAGSAERDFYVWSDDPQRYSDARIIFTDFETSNWSWDPLANAYYWHRFYSHQPDLNFENPAVRRAILDVVDFWMNLGVDGMRLDAVPYLFEEEGTSCENLPQTHAFLRELRSHIDARYADRMLLAEANQWPEDAARYFGRGDECQMNFHFPLMPRMFMAVRRESSFPITDILAQTPEIPDSCQWALFLRNHDELTLEMVTDEDRDYMVEAYAEDPAARINLGIRRRLAPLLRSRPLIELMNGLLMSLPGTPVLYYGDEIGMGDNVYLGDRNGVRTPMQWNGNRNAGFSEANPQRVYLPPIIDPEYRYETINVEAQQGNPASLLWWMKRLIALRREYPLFGRGQMSFLPTNNSKVLAFMRELDDQRVMVVANLSRMAQFVELDLSPYDGATPVELFGGTPFPAIGRLPYLLTLQPHAFFWFELREAASPAAELSDHAPLEAERWTDLLSADHPAHPRLLRRLGSFLQQQRWYRSKARRRTGLELAAALPLDLDAPDGQRSDGKRDDEGGREGRLCLLRASFAEGPDELYVLPLTCTVAELAEGFDEPRRRASVCELALGAPGDAERARGAVLHDAVIEPQLGPALLRLFDPVDADRASRGEGPTGYRLIASDGAALGQALPEQASGRPLGVEQSNSSLVIGETLMLKLLRRLDAGVNPELELLRVLARQGFAHAPRLLGALELAREETGGARRKSGPEPSTLAIVMPFVASEGDAWSMTTDGLHQLYEQLLAQQAIGEADAEALPRPGSWRERLLVTTTVPQPVQQLLLGGYQRHAELMAQRTAELHRALAAEVEDPAFSPEPISPMHQRSLYQSARTRLSRGFELLERALERLPEQAATVGREVIDQRSALDARLRRVYEQPIRATRTRIHGDYHLGQLLYGGGDFTIIDFEGEPARPLKERRYKASPLRDVAGMLRSFHYAAVGALGQGALRDVDAAALRGFAERWQAWTSTVFVRAYLERCTGQSFIPAEARGLRALLEFYLLDKCLYEVAYELNNRPDWAHIPLVGLLELLEADETTTTSGHTSGHDDHDHPKEMR